jgi:hypothetical protein
MNEPTPPMMRVRDWEQLYENNRSREMKRTNWFPAPNDLSADSYVELVEHPDGCGHLGVWHAILMVASKARPRRGLLIREDGRAHDAESLARVTRLPADVIKAALMRLVQIGVLEVVDEEVVDEGATEINDLPPHPPAGSPQDHAIQPQEGAAEGKGKEHHHQEGKQKERNRTPSESFQTEKSSDSDSSARSLRRSIDEKASKVDDDERPAPTTYASPEDELKAIYHEKAGEPIKIALLDAIRANLESIGVSMADFVEEARKHKNNRLKNLAGFLRDFSRSFRAKTCPAAPPVTASEAEEQNYRCPICGSRQRGEGACFVDRKFVPCKCASSEYIARQRERGVFSSGGSEL